MAVTSTPRLGLKQYSSGADPHPSRVEFNAQQARLETLVALAAQGTLAARPSASIWGRLYFATDNARLYWDNGTAWLEVTNVGGGGAGAALAIGGAGSEGVSTRAARADHTHPLPLATSSVNGAMVAADKAKLDGATSSVIGSRVVIRDSGGRAQFSSPSAAADAATKSYVDTQVGTRAPASHTHTWAEVTGKPATFAPDAHTHAWSEVTGKPTTFAPSSHSHTAAEVSSGILAAARLPAATASVQGAMPPEQFAMLTNLTEGIAPNRLVRRDGAGTFEVPSPPGPDNPAHKGYVDTAVATRALTNHTHTWSSITGKPSTFEPSTHYHTAAHILTGRLDPARLPSDVAYQAYVDDLAKPTALVTLSLASQWVAGNAGPPKVRRVGSRVEFLGGMRSTGSTNNQVFTLPVGFRPARDMVIPMVKTESQDQARLVIGADGVCRANVYASSPSYLSLDGAFFLMD